MKRQVVFYLHIAQQCSKEDFLQFCFLKKILQKWELFVNENALLLGGKFKPTSKKHGSKFLHYFMCTWFYWPMYIQSKKNHRALCHVCVLRYFAVKIHTFKNRVILWAPMCVHLVYILYCICFVSDGRTQTGPPVRADAHHLGTLVSVAVIRAHHSAFGKMFIYIEIT